MSDVAGGQIDYVFSDAVFAVGQEKAGKVTMLAVTTPQRLAGLPDIPTMREAGLGNATGRAVVGDVRAGEDAGPTSSTSSRAG